VGFAANRGLSVLTQDLPDLGLGTTLIFSEQIPPFQKKEKNRFQS
jgi:hypothetical protein